MLTETFLFIVYWKDNTWYNLYRGKDVVRSPCISELSLMTEKMIDGAMISFLVSNYFLEMYDLYCNNLLFGSCCKVQTKNKILSNPRKYSKW